MTLTPRDLTGVDIAKGEAHIFLSFEVAPRGGVRPQASVVIGRLSIKAITFGRHSGDQAAFIHFDSKVAGIEYIIAPTRVGNEVHKYAQEAFKRGNPVLFRTETWRKGHPLRRNRPGLMRRPFYDLYPTDRLDGHVALATGDRWKKVAFDGERLRTDPREDPIHIQECRPGVRIPDFLPACATYIPTHMPSHITHR